MRQNTFHSRRSFLKTSAAVAGTSLSAGYWSQLATADSTSPNQQLNIACIGTANRAAANISGVKNEAIVAVCDIDQNYLDRAQEQFPDAQTYVDYRELIVQEADKIDAVVISTADHNHAPAAMRAIRSGKHVYCEKPLSHTVQEARLLAQAAHEYGVATQLGTQVHAYDNYRRIVEIIQSGAIGDVEEVHVWVGKHWGGGELPEGGQEPPATLNWELWLGPASERPFWPGRYHPAQWRRWWQFGGGTLADMACHFMDLPFWALKLRYPISCEAEGPEIHPETCPIGLKVHYEFPEREGLPGVQLTWYDGNMIPREVAGELVPGAGGVMFVGSEGKMFTNYTSYRLFPTEQFTGYVPPAETIPNSIGHHSEWIQACKEGTATTCNFDYSGALTEAVLLGNVAFRTGKKLEWDATTLTATNCSEATAFISKTYRKGWEV